jgi:maltose/moltooligosaccharide transporter
VNPPDEADESPIVPLGHRRSITVYDRVVVGSDGAPTSLYAVDRAAEVAQAAHARLVIVTAYRDDGPGTDATPVEGAHRDLYGFEAGRKALNKSVTGLIRSGRGTSSSDWSAGMRRRPFSTRSARIRRT